MTAATWAGTKRTPERHTSAYLIGEEIPGARQALGGCHYVGVYTGRQPKPVAT